MEPTIQTTDYLPDILAKLNKATSTEQSMEIIGQILQRHPGDPRLWLLIAGEHAQSSRWDAAEAAYITALQIQPQLAIARFQLGLLQLTSGRPSAAMATWQLLEELPELHYLRLFKRGLERLAHDDFENANAQLLAGIANNQENPPLNADMQRILGEIKKLQDANASPESASPDASSAAAHFLVSNYQK